MMRLVILVFPSLTAAPDPGAECTSTWPPPSRCISHHGKAFVDCASLVKNRASARLLRRAQKTAASEDVVSRRPGKMRLGAFFNPTGHHVASWRHPDAQADAGINF